MTKLTLHAAATEAGISRETLSRGLKGLGIKVEPKKTYTLKQIIAAAVGGDIKTERLGYEKARRLALERENMVADGKLNDRSVIEKSIWQDILVPLRMELENLPEKLAGLVNPENPVLAHKILTKAVEDIKLQIANTNMGKAKP